MLIRNKKLMVSLCMGFVMLGTSTLDAKDCRFKLREEEHLQDTKETVAIEIEIEFLDKGYTDKFYTYSFKAAESQNNIFENGWAVPYLIKNKGDQGQETSDIGFLDIGEVINLYPVLAGEEIIVKSDITVSRYLDVKVGEENIPSVNKLKHQVVSVHKDGEFQKIFSANYPDGEKTVNFYIKATLGNKKAE